MSTPAESNSTGWFSRLFGGGTVAASSSTAAEESKTMISPAIKKRVEDAKSLIKNLSPTNGSPVMSMHKNIRTLGSPTAASIIQRVDKDIDRKSRAAQPSLPGNRYERKRVHDNGNPPGLEDIFAHKTTKRFCGTGNLSLVEEPIRISVPDRLDMTWGGDRVDASPASSVRSLKSRLSGANSTTSSCISSRTKAILEQLEKVHTPSKDVHRLPVMRTNTITSEKWNAASAPFSHSITTAAPPLRKQRTATPTRLQLLSTNLGFNKTPYWKDIYRPTIKERDEAAKRKETNGNGSHEEDFNGDRLDPIFEVPKVTPKKPMEERHHRVSVLKGTDGISRNIFNTKDLDDEEEINALPLPKHIKMPDAPAPKKGFLGELTFEFEQPKDRLQERERNGTMNKSFEEQDSSDESDTSDSEIEDSEETSSSSSSSELNQPSSEADKTPEVKEQEKAESPVTFAFSKPTVAKEDTWSCSSCFVNSTGDKCVCCGAPKNGGSAPAPNRELTSNLSTFKPTSGTTITFGTGKTASNEWDCSSCFVKATGDSCPCCGASKTGEKKDLSSSTFKPTIFSSGTTTNSFVFGVDKTAEKAADKPANEKPSTVLTTSSSSPNLFGTSKLSENGKTSEVSKPLFGTSITVPAPTIAAAPAAEASWNCQACFCVSTGTTCVVCGTPKEGTEQKLVSNLSTITPATSTVKFGFGQSTPATKVEDKPTETKTPAFGLNPSTSTPLFGAPKENGSAPVITFGTAPSVPAATEAPKPLFGSSTPLFGAPAAKPADKLLFESSTSAPKITFGAPITKTEPPKITFGAPSTEAPKLTFGASPITAETAKPVVSATLTATEAPKPLFGSSSAGTETSKPLFGSTSTAAEAPKPLFGSTEVPKLTFGVPSSSNEPPKISFGAPASTTEAPKPLFGGTAGAPKPLFGASTEASKSTFGAPPAGGLFGNLSSSNTTSTTPALAFPTFDTSSSTPAFGAPLTSSSFGSGLSDAPSTKKPLFGSTFGSISTEQKAPLFGQSSSSNNLFSQSNTTAAPSTGFNFGATSATPAFNLGSSAPSMTTSASTGSLFSSSVDAPTSFNFGASSSSAGQPFVFGSTPQPTNAPFGQPNLASGAPGGSFAPTSSGPSNNARKIVMARRRFAGGRK